MFVLLRKTRWHYLGRYMVTLIWIICLGMGRPSLANFPEFNSHTIDHVGVRMGQTSLADMDQDGDLDWISGEAFHSQSRIWWWEYQGPDTWVRHFVGKGNTDVGGTVRDLNGDGWMDVFSGSKILINTGKPRTEAFKVYDVGAIVSHDSELADINGDGRLDGLANSDKAGLYWYEIPADPTQAWAAHLIVSAQVHKIHGGVSPKAAGDIDGDGDCDVVTGQAWYENSDGKGLQWKAHRNIEFGEAHQYGIALKTWLIDLDGDQDLDVVQAEADHPDGRVAWFENDGHGQWRSHIIKDKGDHQDFHSLIVADFDGDGDADVFSGGGPLSAQGSHACYIWENKAGPNHCPSTGLWVEHIVARKPCHEAVGGDVDGDGDIDICTKPWSTGNEHVFLRNMSKSSPTVKN